MKGIQTVAEAYLLRVLTSTTSRKETKYKKKGTTRSHKYTAHKKHCAPYVNGIKGDSNSQQKNDVSKLSKRKLKYGYTFHAG
jgi:hypothetical protein